MLNTKKIIFKCWIYYSPSHKIVYTLIEILFHWNLIILTNMYFVWFIIIQSDPKDTWNSNRTLDLTSSLEVGSSATHDAAVAAAASTSNFRSVLTIAFQFPFGGNLQDNVAAMARQYVRSVVSAVQRVAVAISPSGLSSPSEPKLSSACPEAVTLARWICHSYRSFLLNISHFLLLKTTF